MQHRVRGAPAGRRVRWFVPSALAACGALTLASNALAAQPLVPLPVVRLQESAAAPIGEPGAIAAGPGAAFVVADAGEPRLLVFDGRGRLVRTIGRRGGGPGELQGITEVVVDDAGLAYVSDVGRARIVVYRVADGSLVRELPVTGVASTLSVADSLLLMGRVRTTSGQRATMVLARTDGSRTVAIGPYPERWTRAPLLREALGYATVALSGDRIAVALGGLEPIYLTDRSGRVQDSIVLPVLRRRGVPHDIETRFAQPRRYEEELAGQSFVQHLAWITPTRLLVVHEDIVALPRDEFRADVFVSLVDVARRTACVDVPLEIESDVRAQLASRGDTLLLLEQVVGGGPEPVTRVRRFRLDFAECATAVGR